MDLMIENCYDANKRQLNLSHRNLRSLDKIIITNFANRTEYLDLSHNRINNINWIHEFPHLKCLILDGNRLREAHFENLMRPLTSIHTLMLNKNEFSDLKTTAAILRRIFPNVEYLSLHGNALCPDNLFLQPFCTFVPYEYKHYRSVLLNSLPYLKFLDHFAMDVLHSAAETSETKINRQENLHHNKQRQQQILTASSKDLWSKIKSLLTVNADHQMTAGVPNTSNKSSAQHCAKVHLHDKSYTGTHSEGNRFIKNSDL